MKGKALEVLRIMKSSKSGSNYTHPHPDPSHVMRSYRKYLIGQKRIWMAQGKSGHRCLRGLIHYRELIAEYLEAKRACL